MEPAQWQAPLIVNFIYSKFSYCARSGLQV